MLGHVVPLTIFRTKIFSMPVKRPADSMSRKLSKMISARKFPPHAAPESGLFDGSSLPETIAAALHDQVPLLRFLTLLSAQDCPKAWRVRSVITRAIALAVSGPPFVLAQTPSCRSAPVNFGRTSRT